ncbi:MAG: hypothetical protein K2O15_09175, partial [Lachnospiraceae bacterium]|nr:hypothetical protein [Lachnospiraceae bacterium]
MKYSDQTLSAQTAGKISARRNKILAGGVIRLKIFLATSIAGSVFLILYLLYRLFMNPGMPLSLSQGAGYLAGLLLLIFLEFILFWSGII